MSACAHPVQLSLPAGPVEKACGSRQRDHCESCADLYREDAFHLILAGMRGGKGVPATVACHPAVMVTLTAPAFGWPRSPDHVAAFVWNFTVSDLWRRTMVYTSRAIARRLGLSQRALLRLVRVRYVRVAEYQQRGLVHLHAIVRLDKAGDEIRPPGVPFTSMLLAVAVRETVRTVTAPVAAELASATGIDRVGWGTDHDVQTADDPNAARKARYLAKKLGGGPTGPAGIAAAGHALASGQDDPGAEGKLRRAARRLGFRGQAVTKSPRFSTSFRALRQARQEWNERRNAEAPGLRVVAQAKETR